MREVPDLEPNPELGEIRGPAQHLKVIDVSAGLTVDVGDLGQGPGLVRRRDADESRETLRVLRIDVPGHIDPALVLIFLEPRRMDLEDADTLAARSKHADDAVSRDSAAGLE